MRNQKGKKIGLHMLAAALFFVLAMSVCTVKTEAKDYKQGKVYKITAKSKPLKLQEGLIRAKILAKCTIF